MSEQTGWVITPGGPRPRENVHQVNAGDVIFHDRAAGVSSILRAAGVSAKGAAAAEQLVITPGGARPRSLVHEVKPGEVVTATRAVRSVAGEEAKRPDRLSRMALQRATDVLPADQLPALGSGWITYAVWINDTGKTITTLRTTWTVPPPPATQSGQLLYLFNGLQDNPVTHILQPVLQWGVSPDGGGNSWAIASWWVDSSNNAYKTPLVSVNPGDTLVGVMTLLSQAAGSFSYKCEFEGIAGTSLTIQNANELVMPVQTLECYDLTQCSDYPNTDKTAMTAIAIKAGNDFLSPTWNADNAVSDCGQHTIIVSNASPGGEVDLYYRAGKPKPA